MGHHCTQPPVSYNRCQRESSITARPNASMNSWFFLWPGSKASIKSASWILPFMFFQPFPADLWPIQVRRWLPVHCVQCREHFGLRDHPPLTGWPVGRSQWVVHSVDMYKDGQAPGTSPTLWKKLKSRNRHIKNDHNSIREWYGIVLQNVKNGNRPNLLLNCWTGLARPQGTSKTTVKWMSVSAIWPALWNLNLQKWDHVSHLLLFIAA